MWAPRPLSIQNSPNPICTRRPRPPSKLPTVSGTRHPSSPHRRRHWAWRPPPHHLLFHRCAPDALHLPTACGTWLGAPSPPSCSPPTCSRCPRQARLLPTVVYSGLGAPPPHVDTARRVSRSKSATLIFSQSKSPFSRSKSASPIFLPESTRRTLLRPHPCSPTDPRSGSLSGRASSPAPQQAWRSVFTVEERRSRPGGLLRRGPPLRLRRPAPRPVSLHPTRHLPRLRRPPPCSLRPTPFARQLATHRACAV
jgi:hypothetical protein